MKTSTSKGGGNAVTTIPADTDDWSRFCFARNNVVEFDEDFFPPDSDMGPHTDWPIEAAWDHLDLEQMTEEDLPERYAGHSHSWLSKDKEVEISWYDDKKHNWFVYTINGVKHHVPLHSDPRAEIIYKESGIWQATDPNRRYSTIVQCKQVGGRHNQKTVWYLATDCACA
jgi:hypothetical protein